MKKHLLFLTFTLLCSLTSFAQIDKEDIAIAEAIFGKTKKMIVADYMQIPDTEHVFWKLYDEYEGKRKVISSERLGLLNLYAAEYDSLNDANAAKLAEAYIANTDKSNKLNKMYFRKFNKAVGGLKAATLYQIETFIETSVRAKLQSEIPVIGELQKMRNR